MGVYKEFGYGLATYENGAVNRRRLQHNHIFHVIIHKIHDFPNGPSLLLHLMNVIVM